MKVRGSPCFVDEVSGLRPRSEVTNLRLPEVSTEEDIHPTRVATRKTSRDALVVLARKVASESRRVDRISHLFTTCHLPHPRQDMLHSISSPLILRIDPRVLDDMMATLSVAVDVALSRVSDRARVAAGRNLRYHDHDMTDVSPTPSIRHHLHHR